MLCVNLLISFPSYLFSTQVHIEKPTSREEKRQPLYDLHSCSQALCSRLEVCWTLTQCSNPATLRSHLCTFMSRARHFKRALMVRPTVSSSVFLVQSIFATVYVNPGWDICMPRPVLESQRIPLPAASCCTSSVPKLTAISLSLSVVGHATSWKPFPYSDRHFPPFGDPATAEEIGLSKLIPLHFSISEYSYSKCSRSTQLFATPVLTVFTTLPIPIPSGHLRFPT